MVLFDWQKKLLEALFVRNARTGKRKYRTALVGVSRKNGKSSLASAIALYGLVMGPNGAEVYSCAGSRQQARIVFETAAKMVQLDPYLSEMVTCYRDVLEVPSTGSIYRVLSSEGGLQEGLSPTLVCFDEVHVQPNSELWDVMTLGSGAREEPLVLGITTAGSRTDSLGGDTIAYQLYQYGRRIVQKEIADPTFFFAWWEPQLGLEADHRDPKVWAEANPGYDQIVSPADFKSTVLRTSEAEFRTKRTNCWTTGQESALPYGAWDACVDTERTVGKETPVVVFFDGSWAGDSTGLVAATIEEQPHLFVVGCWENMDDAEWRVPILDVEDRIRQVCKDWQVVEVACDPYRWQRSMQVLEAERLPIVEFPMTLPRVVPGYQKWSEAVLEKRLTHDGNPVLARHVENMVLKKDARGIRPVKESKSSRRHIDLAICAIFAHDRAVSRVQQGPTREWFGAWA